MAACPLRWAEMSFLAVLISICLGMLWHTVVFVLIGWPLSDAISSFAGMQAGAFAGLCAGYLTCLSRKRHQGRESKLDAVLAYYAAAVIYSLVSALIRTITGEISASVSCWAWVACGTRS